MKLRLGIFGLFALILFLFIRLYATYPSNSGTVAAPTPTQPVGYEPIALTTQAAVDQRFILYRFPNGTVQFEHPDTWTLQERSPTEVFLRDTQAISTSGANVTVTRETLGGQTIEAKAGCNATTSPCQRRLIGVSEFLVREAPSLLYATQASSEAILFRSGGGVAAEEIEQILETVAVE